MTSPNATTPLLLIPLDRQPTRTLVALLLMVAIGLPLRPDLRRPGRSDTDVVRDALRRREWRVEP